MYEGRAIDIIVNLVSYVHITEIPSTVLQQDMTAMPSVVAD
jgi:hypothetical protein